MGYVPPTYPPRLNVDKDGLPRDYATYVWLHYRKHVDDRSPERLAFLYGPGDGSLRDIAGRMQRTIFYGHPNLGTQEITR